MTTPGTATSAVSRQLVRKGCQREIDHLMREGATIPELATALKWITYAAEVPGCPDEPEDTYYDDHLSPAKDAIMARLIEAEIETMTDLREIMLLIRDDLSEHEIICADIEALLNKALAAVCRQVKPVVHAA